MLTKKIIFAITGASGALYAQEFAKLMVDQDVEMHCLISAAGQKVLGLELGLERSDLPGVTSWFDVHDLAAPMASGSAGYSAMVILPCSMGTLAAIAGGLSQNLIHRAADVALKERIPLVLAVRETPFNRTHLCNMLTVHDAGATICPAMPALYQQPKSLSAMAHNFAARVAGLIGIEADYPRWQGLT